LLLAIDHELKG